MKKMQSEKLVPFEVMQVLFDLDERDEAFNRVLLDSAHETVEKFLDRKLSVKHYMERLQAENGVLTVKEYPIIEVIYIENYATDKSISPITAQFECEDNRFILLSTECANGVFDVEYCAGYEAETVPAPLVEAVTKLFMHKRHSFLDAQNTNTATKEKPKTTAAIPEEIKELLHPYQRKRL